MNDVDRGAHSVEAIAHLVGVEESAPMCVAMQRGNDESREGNGDVEHNGVRSLRRRCENVFGACGAEEGEEGWREERVS